jgi:hypothetical protein
MLKMNDVALCLLLEKLEWYWTTGTYYSSTVVVA